MIILAFPVKKGCCGLLPTHPLNGILFLQAGPWISNTPHSAGCREAGRVASRIACHLQKARDWVRESELKCKSTWAGEWVSEGGREWMSEWVNEWMSEWVNEWMSEWVSEKWSGCGRGATAIWGARSPPFRIVRVLLLYGCIVVCVVLLKGQKGGRLSEHGRVMQPSVVTTYYWSCVTWGFDSNLTNYGFKQAIECHNSETLHFTTLAMYVLNSWRVFLNSYLVTL